MAASQEVKLRDLTSDSEFREVVALQREIWEFSDLDLLPVRFFVVASKVGGQVFGAFDGDRMVAFCLAIPGLKEDGTPYLHSHMLGVLPDYRDIGLGRRMKLHQRERALARGIHLIQWTFDPLQTRNAHFNIQRLGAIVRTYQRNVYGYTSSPLTGGLPTDRLVAEWHISSPPARGTVVREIPIPAAMDTIRRNEPERAAEIQCELAAKFEAAFASGLAVIATASDGDWFRYGLGAAE